MPPKKRTPTPAPTPSGMPSKFPTNPTNYPPISGTSTLTPSTPRTIPSTSTSIVPPATVTPSESFSPTGQQDPTSSAPPKKRTRGPNRSKGMSHFISQGEKLNVAYKQGELHPYGKNASRLASEIGIIVRDHAPLKVKGWSKVDDVDKEIIYTRIKGKFNLNLSDPDLMKIIDSHCSNRYKNYRSSMHGYYKDMVKNGEDPRAHPPSNMRSTEDWEWLCDNIFSNPQWLNRSNASVRNRGKLPHVHRGGSKSFIAHRTQEVIREVLSSPTVVVYEISDDIVELGRIELFRNTHWNAAHGWINEEAASRYNSLLELRQQREDNNEVVDEAAICAQVLGCERNGYIPGLGPIPRKGHTQTSSQVEAQIQQRVGDMADQMRMDFQRERNEMVTTLRRQLRDELLEEVRREMIALMNGPDEHPSTPYQQQPPPPPPPAPAV
ncbi:hypothetical protein TIFTF001_042018 [Ficus carica]|nr:hypothetical protein TIFTF001_042018 [Ficus carica]